MRDLTEWLRGAAANRREALQLSPGLPDLGASMHDIVAGRSNLGDRAVRVGTQGVERATDIEGTPIHGFEDEQAAAILFIGTTTETNADPTQHGSEPRFPGPGVNGAMLYNTAPTARAQTSGSGVSDITARSLRQARLRVDELVAASQRKDEFLAVLGHELRNPLTSINNGMQLLKHQTQDTPAWQRTQAMIERQVRQMRQLVDDLMDVSRITHGHLQLKRERIDLRNVVSNAIETLESDINERHHRLTAALPDTPVWLLADPGRLEQVFVNLLANASRYTDAGGELMV